MHRRHVYASKLLYMISGKLFCFCFFFKSSEEEKRKKCSRANRRPHQHGRVHGWRGRHEPSAPRTIRLQRGRRSQWEDGAPLPGGQAGKRWRRLAEEQERKRKRKKKKQTSPTDFMILIGSEGDSSIMDQWSLRSVLQGKEEKSPPSLPSSFWVSRRCNVSRPSDKKAKEITNNNNKKKTTTNTSGLM